MLISLAIQKSKKIAHTPLTIEMYWFLELIQSLDTITSNFGIRRNDHSDIMSGLKVLANNSHLFLLRSIRLISSHLEQLEIDVCPLDPASSVKLSIDFQEVPADFQSIF